MTTEEFTEECWFVYGVRIGKFFMGFKKFHSKGTSGSVDFSWKKAMNPFLIGWVHTHGFSNGFLPSETDNSTMRSWVRSRNKPMLCGISCDGRTVWYNYIRKKDLSIMCVPTKVTYDRRKSARENKIIFCNSGCELKHGICVSGEK